MEVVVLAVPLHILMANAAKALYTMGNTAVALLGLAATRVPTATKPTEKLTYCMAIEAPT